MLWKANGGPELDRPWDGPVAEIYYGWGRLGRDMAGVTLQSERESWLRANGWMRDSGQEEAGYYFFLVLENEMSEVRKILYPTPTPKAGGK